MQSSLQTKLSFAQLLKSLYSNSLNVCSDSFSMRWCLESLPPLYWSRNEGLGWAILHTKVNRAFSCDVITFQSTKENGTATMLVFKKTVASMAILANGSSMCWIGQYTTAMYQRFICGVFNCYYIATDLGQHDAHQDSDSILVYELKIVWWKTL